MADPRTTPANSWKVTFDAGLGSTISGGLLTGIGSVFTVSFGPLPTVLVALGGILIGVGLIEKYIFKK